MYRSYLIYLFLLLFCGLKVEALSKSECLLKLDEIHNHSNKIWGESQRILSDIIEDNGLVYGVEIGVAFGRNIVNLAENTSIEKIIGIDPYKQYASVVYPEGMNLLQELHDILFEQTRLRLEALGERVELFRMESVEASRLFKELSLDFVYIDGNHTYKSVLNDLECWYSKVMHGGFLIGNDYDHPNHKQVKIAVDEFFEKKGLEVKIEKWVWWVQKPSLPSSIIPTYNREKQTLRHKLK